jgi:hypothetical protein
MAARGDPAAFGTMMLPAPVPTTVRPPEKIRGARCEHSTDTPWGSLTVHYVLLTSISVAMAITARLDPSMPIPQSQATLADDRGGTVVANFNGGGGGGNSYTGQLVAYQPLSRDTRWIGVDGDRVDLIDDGDAGIAVRVEDLPPSSAAQRHLWDVLNAGRGPMFHRGQPLPLEPVVNVLVAAGALAPDDPVIDEVRTVADALATGVAGPALSPRWAAVLSGGSHRGIQRMGPGGPATHRAVPGRLLPPIDGRHVRVDVIEQRGGTLVLTVAVSPSWALGSMDTAMEGAPIEWWATDDRGNQALGWTGHGGFGGDEANAEVVFHPPLDPGAGIQVMATAGRQRAVMTIDALPAVR